MKNHDLKAFLLVLLVFSIFTTGCVSSRVGKVSFIQAVHEFGQPVKTEHVLPNMTRSTWLTKEVRLTSTLVSTHGIVSERITHETEKPSWKILMALIDHSNEKAIIPKGVEVGSIRKGKLSWLHILTFGEDGMCKKDEEITDLSWQEWNQN